MFSTKTSSLCFLNLHYSLITCYYIFLLLSGKN